MNDEFLKAAIKKLKQIGASQKLQEKLTEISVLTSDVIKEVHDARNKVMYVIIHFCIIRFSQMMIC